MIIREGMLSDRYLTANASSMPEVLRAERDPFSPERLAVTLQSRWIGYHPTRPEVTHT